MRILHLVSYPLYSGPVPSVLALARGQQAAGHTVYVAVDAKRGNFNGYEEAALPHLTQLNLQPPLPLVLSNRCTPGELWRDWQHLRRMRAGLDVVHTHFSHDHALVGLMARRGVLRVRTVHAARSLRQRFGQAWLARQVDGWVVRCARHADSLVHGFNVSPARVLCVPGSIDASRWVAPMAARAVVRARFNIPTEAPVIGHVALQAGRGQEELLEAVANLGASASLHVLLVGRGERERNLKELVERLGLAGRVHFTGYVPEAALPELYAAMDAAFLAQVGNDAAGRAGLEAMAAGVPLLAVMGEALGELLDGERGYPLLGRQPAAVMEGLVAWLSDRERGRQLGGAGQRYILLERTVDQEVQAVLRFYARLQTQARHNT